MNIKVLCTSLFLATTAIASGQTTMEEFKYITEAYELQVRNGLGNKAGYEFDTLGQWGMVDGDKAYQRMFYFLGLRQTANNKIKAIMVDHEMTRLSDTTITHKYLCIPHPSSNQSVMNKSHINFCELDAKSYQAYSWALIQYLQYYDDVFK